MSEAVATAHLSGASDGRNVEYFSLHLLNQKSRCPLQLVFWLMSVILISHSRYYLVQIFPFSETKLAPRLILFFFFFFVNKDSLKHSHAHYTLAVTCYDGRVRQFKHKAYVVTVQHCTEKNLLNSDLKQGGIEMNVPYFVNDHCCIT